MLCRYSLLCFHCLYFKVILLRIPIIMLASKIPITFHNISFFTPFLSADYWSAFNSSSQI